MATTNYPFPSYHFQVDWGNARIGFTEVSGLSVESEMLEYRDGSNYESHSTKFPGRQKYANISLKRGLFRSDNSFYEWWNTVAQNTIERRDVIISLLDEEHEPVMTWKVKGAWPLKVEGPSLNSTGNEVAIESLELAHEGLTIEAN